ncbi:YoaK family protein [Thiomicrorhabdus sp.]|uniref:YoaK family protein n=1 Tax=Thiomicrorhabdus sp. TaxID=2039724 RepID=UPI002AA9469F|nr:YoaK family protein [Thiomicrorhabdus sp.]
MPYPIKEHIENDVDFKLSATKLYVISFIMTLIAGYINSAMLIEFGIPVSQMTGVSSRMSDAIVDIEWIDLLNNFMILSGFFGGAFISGWLIGHSQYQTTPNYGYALLLNCILLSLATFFSFIQSDLSLLLAAIACGLQNALVASYRGLQIRTTHVTGTVTDLGVHLAQKIKHKRAWSWKGNALIVLLLGFIIGGVIGIFAYRLFPNWSLVFPALITLILGLAYLYQFRSRQPTN